MADGGPYALDADAADAVLAVRGEELWLAPGHGPVRTSLDPARRLAPPLLGGEPLARGAAVAAAAERAADWAAFATAAQSLGVGLALLDRTVAYVKQRTQFGRAIGSFQAVQHQLADVLIGLEFARPLLHGAAVALAAGGSGARAEVAAAKVAAGDAAYAAARTALQLHGAIGYTDEYDLSLWIRKARALRGAWGSPSACRARVLAP
ncbi:putative acyl-CoA dehydrogenase [Streptomyces himastatinicus ATCC 53653]|uniref:Putative acyl-CoA dehydrogenase n=2 Tax=Streptomyces violaceusniger group TaxID=2839105 RepID=D9W9J0_9ACTN|nr:putative acyl-CoA dehydrogenase [Streptomyces himastatinicus ATCC 53653]